MKLHSVQFKFLTTVISAILIISIFVGGLTTYEMNSYVQEHTKEIVDITCASEASRINDIFGDIEDSVLIMESYVLSLCSKLKNITNPDVQKTILQLAGEMFVNVASNTDGAVTYYLRFDPSISDGKTGIFYSQMDGKDEYVCLEPTDISLYNKDDIERVGWFWIPYEAGSPIWLDPYYNQNNGILMISYVIPLYFENQFIGVVGMDFDYNVLTERIHQIKIFEHGFAHIEHNGVVIHTGKEYSHDNELNIDNEQYFKASSDLINGMKLVLFANYDDINQIRHETAYKILISVVLMALAFTLIVFFIVKKIVKPLKSLTAAAAKLSDEDYEIEIEHSDTFEIQQLSTAFENMLEKLREHKMHQLLLTYRDSMTGLRNTTAYKDWVVEFNKKIKYEDISFGVVVFDLNYLKQTNDTYGHIAGNNLIITASQIIANTFKKSPVFRIGGDEFVAILQNHDLEDRDMLFSQFEATCENTTIEANGELIPVSLAKGFAMFDPSTDTQFSDVFNRADEKMYQHKKQSKMVLL